MSTDPAAVAANAAVAAATAAVQALSSHLPLAASPQHKLALPSFWLDNPAGWFQHAEAEFTLARLPANSYICYVHVIRALPSEVLAAVRDLMRVVTAATPGPYLLIKDALLTRFTASPLQRCFRILDMAPLGNRRPSVLFAEMHSLLPQDANVLFNAIYLRYLPDSMRAALADRGELLPGDLAAAADLLHHTTRPSASTIAAATPLPPSPPPSLSVAAVHTPSPVFNPGLPIATAIFPPSAVPPLLIAATTRFHAHLLVTTSVSTITTSADRLAAASCPAPGRETSSGPGGSTLLRLTGRGPSSTPHR
jgi:hypothetical protein